MDVTCTVAHDIGCTARDPGGNDCAVVKRGSERLHEAVTVAPIDLKPVCLDGSPSVLLVGRVMNLELSAVRGAASLWASWWGRWHDLDKSPLSVLRGGSRVADRVKSLDYGND